MSTSAIVLGIAGRRLTVLQTLQYELITGFSGVYISSHAAIWEHPDSLLPDSHGHVLLGGGLRVDDQMKPRDEQLLGVYDISGSLVALSRYWLLAHRLFANICIANVLTTESAMTGLVKFATGMHTKKKLPAWSEFNRAYRKPSVSRSQ
jgi:hypothetical protein